MISCCLTLPSECQQKSRLIRLGNFGNPKSNFVEPLRIISLVSCSYLTSVCSSAAVALLLQGSTCCVFRDALQQISVGTSGYLSYCCLSISSNQSSHSPLTSGINKTFSPTELLFTRYFHFFRPFSVNPRYGCA